jgi:hypothetical protein
MTEFNRMTLVAAAEVITEFHSHDKLDVLEAQWDLTGRCNTSSKAARVASLVRIAAEDNPTVMTEVGITNLSRALLELAIQAPENVRRTPVWNKLIAGLRFDGFDLSETETQAERRHSWLRAEVKTSFTLARMLPQDIPETDFREAEAEVVQLLDRYGFGVSCGHLKLALSAFQRGEWSAANGELRKFYEGYLNEISEKLGYTGGTDSKMSRDFLGKLKPPFLLADYNEWNENNQKPQYVQGLMSRMHPHGGHPGLSEEEDATFRLQIILITARLFLRRYDRRVRGV